MWVALRLIPDWRWQLERDDSPSYPTMRLFRQTTRDDWKPVFAAMAEVIGVALEASRRSGPTPERVGPTPTAA